MQLFFAGLPLFAANGAEVTSHTTVITTSYGRPVAYDVALDVKGYLEGAGQAVLTGLENTLRSILSGYGDLALKQDTGVNSGLALANVAAISGVRIVDGPHFEEAMNAEYVNRRTVRFTGQARFTIRSTETAVMSWSETLSFQGTCGPVTRFRPAVNAPPVQQMVYPSSTMKVTQTGRAVGHLVRPDAPPPIWPFPIEQVDQRLLVLDPGRRVGPGTLAVVEPAIQWRYVYESDVPLAAFPSIPPL